MEPTEKAILNALLKMARKEARHYKQFYDMFDQGFENEKPGHDRYVLIQSAIDWLKARLEALSSI